MDLALLRPRGYTIFSDVFHIISTELQLILKRRHMLITLN
jgi:hypothetical protein